MRKARIGQRMRGSWKYSGARSVWSGLVSKLSSPGLPPYIVYDLSAKSAGNGTPRTTCASSWAWDGLRVERVGDVKLYSDDTSIMVVPKPTLSNTTHHICNEK